MATASGYFCFSCGEGVLNPKVGRRDACTACGADLHVCKNCMHYDERAYNECREPQADRVLEKTRSNFCDYFSFRSGGDRPKGGSSKEDRIKKLDDIFK
jgi:hypothetical protein